MGRILGRDGKFTGRQGIPLEDSGIKDKNPGLFIKFKQNPFSINTLKIF